ncbi:MAG: DUF3137 domain-containing protein [Alphaproteobacteria bacterium]|nr:DUF3137 domain-containing protein [Alphaproteobacteria bacterium]
MPNITSSTISRLENLRRQYLRKWARDVIIAAAAVYAWHYAVVNIFYPGVSGPYSAVTRILDSEPLFYSYAVCAFLLALAMVWQPLSYRKSIKGMAWPAICESFRNYQLEYHASKRGFKQDAKLVSLSSAKAAEKLYRGTIENDDVFKGRHLDYDFEIIEATMTAGSGRSRTTTFRGLVIGVLAHGLFPAQAIVLRNGMFKSPNNKIFKRVKLDGRFEKAYSAFASDEAAARQMLAAEKISKITAVASRVEKAGHNKSPEFAFLGEGFFLFVTTRKNHFELGHIWSKIDRVRTFRQAVKDIEAAIGLIKMLQQEKLLPCNRRAGRL